MKLLLDTHIWLWGLSDSDRLSRRARKELADPANEVWLSPISVWEALTLHSKRRITMGADPENWVAGALRTHPLQEAPLTFDVALEANRIVLPHRDPVDRILVATARVFDLTLVTSDKTLIEARVCPVLASR